MTWLILELSEADQWEPRHGSRVIPAHRRPTMLQPSRFVAENEARRLAAMRPGCRFVVFEAVAAGITATVPTHVNLLGEVVRSRDIATVVEIIDPDDEVPF